MNYHLAVDHVLAALATGLDPDAEPAAIGLLHRGWAALAETDHTWGLFGVAVARALTHRPTERILVSCAAIAPPPADDPDTAARVLALTTALAGGYRRAADGPVDDRSRSALLATATGLRLAADTRP